MGSEQARPLHVSIPSRRFPTHLSSGSQGLGQYLQSNKTTVSILWLLSGDLPRVWDPPSPFLGLKSPDPNPLLSQDPRIGPHPSFLLLQIQDSRLPASSFQSSHPSPPPNFKDLRAGEGPEAPMLAITPLSHQHVWTCQNTRGLTIQISTSGFPWTHQHELCTPHPPLTLGLGCGHTCVHGPPHWSLAYYRSRQMGSNLTGPRSKVSLVLGTQARLCIQPCIYVFEHI